MNDEAAARLLVCVKDRLDVDLFGVVYVPAERGPAPKYGQLFWALIVAVWASAGMNFYMGSLLREYGRQFDEQARTLRQNAELMDRVTRRMN
jgi:hypothetical protein